MFPMTTAASFLLPPPQLRRSGESGSSTSDGFPQRYCSKEALLSLSSKLMVLASLVWKEQFGEVVKDMGHSPDKGNGNPLQYSFLENSMDRGAWQTIKFIGSQRVGHNLPNEQQQPPLRSELCLVICIPGTNRPPKSTCQVTGRSRAVHKWREGWSGMESWWKAPKQQEGPVRRQWEHPD